MVISPEFDGHGWVVFCRDAEADLLGVIAVHCTARGPAGTCATEVAIQTLDLNFY